MTTRSNLSAGILIRTLHEVFDDETQTADFTMLLDADGQRVAFLIRGLLRVAGAVTERQRRARQSFTSGAAAPTLSA